uniref:Uncharacterized protein n=1 Tax=uncultured gamma proteobacterium HF0010_16J05 TaxID=710981 RepID=E0XR39_9GAMM|nr:hypothetical protein [uncultured gamma proteobacterium HF0010_16J05]
MWRHHFNWGKPRSGIGSPKRLVRLVLKREWKRFRCKARIGLIQS